MSKVDDYYWLMVTGDKYEFPLYIAESLDELADYCHHTMDSIRTAAHRNTSGKNLGYTFRRCPKR